ncbi:MULTISPECIES: endospore germination permease [unclassified Paenibacillus]|uniref:GerAB/ArcD/ProY family transporter n=1 Tax=unclassified Paenibacillus TaxID=185978 RepID=UPI001AE6AB97|nr:MULTISPECIES: endospore germination permease [unclassified Paenibacillus]MBP1154207.1 spore germination protein KB [Paenibacillus sp. PvP091]MBP1170408.1 spore germination protein KB [Paenibacillus sp. PvR098]MBP2441436.1 spore germination protein KB [Paenibacillus sp. PvP052]
MLETGKIGVRQFTVLTILFTIGTSILIAPSGLSEVAKQDAWIASIVGMGLGLLTIPLYNSLANRFPNMTIAEYSEAILGKWSGKTVFLLYFTFIFLLTAQMLSNLGYFITTQIMPETPIQVVIILFILVTIMAVRLGLEVWTRAAEIFFPWVILLFLLLVAALLPEVKLSKIQPVFEGGLKPVLHAAINFFGLQQNVILLMVFPYVNQKIKAGSAFLTGTLLGGMFLIIITLLSILVLGEDITTRNVYPSYSLAKRIGRLEAVMAGLWFISIYFKIIICFYASVIGLAQIFNLKEFRPLLFPLGIIMLVLSLLVYPNLVYIQLFIAKIWTPYALTFMLFLPLFLLAVAVMRKKFEPTESDKNR